VRMMKPKRVLETGTFLGIAASFIALALRENKQGRLTTIECVLTHVEKAKELFAELELTHYVEVIHSHVEDWDPEGNRYEVIFIDSSPSQRFGEMVRFWPNLEPGGVMLVHDLRPHGFQPAQFFSSRADGGFGKLPEELKSLVRTHQLQSFHFDTPTGLYLAQKAKPDFYTSKLLKEDL